MGHPMITRCPVCQRKMQIKVMQCEACKTRIEGEFEPDRFNYLTPEQKHFVEVFLRCRGNIREVEKELDISYPTVRGRLEDVVATLGYTAIPDAASVQQRQEVLTALEKGDLNYEEALKRMKDL